MTVFVKGLRSYGYRILAYIDDFHIAPLPCGTTATLAHMCSSEDAYWPPHETIGASWAGGKGRMGRLPGCGTSGGSRRQPQDALLHCEEESRKGERVVWAPLEASENGAALGFCEGIVTFLWHMRVPFPGAPVVEISHSLFVLGRGRTLSQRWQRTMSALAPVHQGPEILARLGKGEPFWATKYPSQSTGPSAYKRRRNGVWRNNECGGLSRRGPWDVERSRGLVVARSGPVHNAPGAQGGAYGPLGKEVSGRGLRDLFLHIDNQSVVHITNRFVSASRPMMLELRRLKFVQDHFGVRIRSS